MKPLIEHCEICKWGHPECQCLTCTKDDGVCCIHHYGSTCAAADCPDYEREPQAASTGEHTKTCSDVEVKCQCYTCRNDNHCDCRIHGEHHCDEHDCPDYEPEEQEGEHLCNENDCPDCERGKRTEGDGDA